MAVKLGAGGRGGLCAAACCSPGVFLAVAAGLPGALPGYRSVWAARISGRNGMHGALRWPGRTGLPAIGRTADPVWSFSSVLAGAAGLPLDRGIIPCGRLDGVLFLCYSAGCVYLYRLAAWELGKGAARRTVLFLSLFPYAFFFGGVMTEGLFLLTTAAALWHIRRHRCGGRVCGVFCRYDPHTWSVTHWGGRSGVVESLGKFDRRAILRRL